MSTICQFCGGACGRVCRGLGFKSSDGGGESRPAADVAQRKERRPGPKDGGSNPSKRKVTTSAGVAPGPSETKPKNKIIEGLKEAIAVARGDVPAARITVMPRGRPLAKDAAKALMQTKPWLSEGMSRASWYRRKKDRGEKE